MVLLWITRDSGRPIPGAPDDFGLEPTPANTKIADAYRDAGWTVRLADLRDCANCEGHGVVEVQLMAKGTDTFPRYRERECRECDGAGKRYVEIEEEE